MITHLGRVVYDRKKHHMDEKDLVRMVEAFSDSDKSVDFARAIAKIQVRYLFDEDLSVISVIAFIIATLVPMATFLDMGLKELLKKLSDIFPG